MSHAKNMKNAVPLLMAFALASTWANVKDDIAAKESSIASLRAALSPLAKPLIVSDGSDLRVFVSLSPVVSEIAKIAAQPPEKRTITVKSTAANGYFYRSGGLGCGAYVELQGGGDLHASARIDGLSAVIGADGSVSISSVLNVTANAQLHGHVGPPRVLGACIGGGVGTSVGVSATKAQPVTIGLSFARSADNMIAYSVGITDPKHVEVTASIGLSRLGNVGVPMGFDLPQTPLASGQFPLLIARTGSFRLPGAGERSYSLVLTPTVFSGNTSGITAGWKATAQFAPPKP